MEANTSDGRDLLWWVKCVVHNTVIHPLLPLADAAEELIGANAVSALVYRLHDVTAPYGGG